MTEIKIEVLCKHWNGYEDSCKRGNECKYKHSLTISGKEDCRNWIKYGSCYYGQNCNYFHRIGIIGGEGEDDKDKKSVISLEKPKKGRKPNYIHLNTTTFYSSCKTSEYIFKL